MNVTAVDVFGKEYQVDVSSLTWRPSVYGIVIEDGKLLVVRQFKTKFDIPGGGVDLGEDLEAAVVREVKEETGFDVEVVRLVDLRANIFSASHATNNNYHSIMIYYECKKVGGEISTEGFDEWEQQYAQGAEWLPLTDLDSVELASTIDYRDIVRGVASGN